MLPGIRGHVAKVVKIGRLRNLQPQWFSGLAHCAQKAGTTWLHDALRQSREVHFSRNKELHYFDVIAGKANQVLALRNSALVQQLQDL